MDRAGRRLGSVNPRLKANQTPASLPRHCRAGIVHVFKLPEGPGLFLDFRFPAISLDRGAVLALGDEVPVELDPRGFAVYMYGHARTVSFRSENAEPKKL